MRSKVIIAIVILILLAGVGVFIFITYQKQNQNAAQNSAQSTTGSGGVGGSVGTIGGTGGSQNTGGTGSASGSASQNSAQPFTALLPRQGKTNQPAATTGSGSSSSSNNNQTSTVASGTPTIDAGDVGNPDYTNLTTNQFLAKYYPDYQQVIAGQTPGDQAINAADPIVTSGADTTTVQTIPDTSGLDSANFQISTNNSPKAIQNYVQTIATDTAGLDLIDNTNTLVSLIQSPDPTTIAAQSQQVQSILTAVQAVSAPSSVIGMHKEIYNLYQNYANVLNDITAINNLGKGNPANQPDPNSLASQLTTDTNAVTNSMSQIVQDSNIIQNNNQIISSSGTAGQ